MRAINRYSVAVKNDELVAFLLSFSSGLMSVLVPFSLSYTEYVMSPSKQEIFHTCSEANGQEQPHVECHCYQHQEVECHTMKDMHRTLQQMQGGRGERER